MNILVAQSGGPTAAINASLAGVISRAAAQWPDGKILGGCNGIQGILEEHIVDLKEMFCPGGKPDEALLRFMIQISHAITQAMPMPISVSTRILQFARRQCSFGSLAAML